MAARILVVDDMEPNRRLLQVRLEAEGYEVITAEDGRVALYVLEQQAVDLVLLDVMMPEIDGFEVCRCMRANPRLAQIPVVMVTALDERSDRLAGLAAGADDFLTKPWDEAVLLARVRSLLRLKGLVDDLISRQETSRALLEMDAGEQARVATGARILIVDDPSRAAESLVRRLEDDHRPRLETDETSARRVASGQWDLVIVHCAAQTMDGLGLVEHFKSQQEKRDLPILAIVDEGDKDLTVRALDAGANDVIERPIDGQELAARVKSLVKHKRYADFWRARLDDSLITQGVDQLTQVATQRVAEVELRRVVGDVASGERAASLALIDIDGLRDVNRMCGHHVGDQMLKAIAQRISPYAPAGATLGRRAGDEFILVIPNATADRARDACKFMREAVASRSFSFPRHDDIAVTVSIGLTQIAPQDTTEAVVQRAEKALETAKLRGANRVVTALRKSLAA